MKPQGKVYLEGFNVEGGDFNGSAGSGVGIAGGAMVDSSLMYSVVVRGNEGAGFSDCHGIHRRIELTNTTTNAAALGFIGSGIKCVDEAVIEHSYVHDNQGNGVWSDEFCHDSASHPNGFWVHDNLVVNNGFNGIRFERVGEVSTAGEALIENNEVYDNSLKLKVPSADLGQILGL